MLINSCHYALFLLKSSKTSHLNRKDSDMRAKYSDEWSPGGGGTPPPALIGFGLVDEVRAAVLIKDFFLYIYSI